VYSLRLNYQDLLFKEKSKVMSPVIQAVICLLLSTIFVVLIFRSQAQELSFAYPIAFIALSLFALVNPIILYFQTNPKRYAFLSGIIFLLGLIYFNWFSIGIYTNTINILRQDHLIINLLLVFGVIEFYGISLLIKKLRSKRNLVANVKSAHSTF